MQVDKRPLICFKSTPSSSDLPFWDYRHNLSTTLLRSITLSLPHGFVGLWNGKLCTRPFPALHDDVIAEWGQKVKGLGYIRLMSLLPCPTCTKSKGLHHMSLLHRWATEASQWRPVTQREWHLCSESEQWVPLCQLWGSPADRDRSHATYSVGLLSTL